MKKWNKILIGIVFTIFISSLVFALNLSNPKPIENEIIMGDGSVVDFWIISDDNPNNATTGGVSIDGGGWQTLNCVNNIGTSNCSKTIDMSGWVEKNYTVRFYVNDGILPTEYYPNQTGTYSFELDLIPSKPLNLQVNGLNESALYLDWDDNSEMDISNYTIYQSDNSGINISDVGTYNTTFSSQISNYTSTGLTVGKTYYFVVTAIDARGQESISSDEKSQIVADSTPPIQPVITPPSGSEINITNPTIHINYTSGGEDVTLKIMTAGTVIKTFNSGREYNWTPSLADNTTYFFQMNSTDQFNNWRLDNYTITVKSGALFNISILDTEHLTTTFFPEKTNVLPGDFIIIGVNVSMYPDEYIRMNMTDWTSASDTILLTDMNPIFFCGEDYDSLAQDIVGTPTKNTYNIEYAINLSQAALDCTDTNPSGLIDYTAYIKATIPVGTDSGAYSFGYTIESFSTVI